VLYQLGHRSLYIRILDCLQIKTIANFMSSFEDPKSAVTAEAESTDNLPANAHSGSANTKIHLRKTIKLLEAELEAKEARLTEAAFKFRAAACNKARLEDEKASLLKREKPRVFEIAKLNKKIQLSSGRLDLCVESKTQMHFLNSYWQRTFLPKMKGASLIVWGNKILRRN
jgi:hypothetical protein